MSTSLSFFLLLLNLRLAHAGTYTHLSRRPRTRVGPQNATREGDQRIAVPKTGRTKLAPRQTAPHTLTPRRTTTGPTSRPRTRCTSGVTNTRGQRANAGAWVDQRIHGATGPQLAPRSPGGVSRAKWAKLGLPRVGPSDWGGPGATMAPSRGRRLWCASHPPTRPPRCAHRKCARRRRLTRDASRVPPRRLVAVIFIGVNPAASLLRRRYVQAPRHPTLSAPREPLHDPSLSLSCRRRPDATAPARAGSWGPVRMGLHEGVAPLLLRSLAPAPSLSRGRMQLVDYSDSESDEPVPPSMLTPCVVAGEQGNSTGRTSGRATVSTPHPTLVELASSGSADKPSSQNVQPLRDATNATTAAAPLATGVQADAPAAEQVCSAIPLVLRWGTGRVCPCGARGEVADWARAPGVRERRDLLPAARCAGCGAPSLSSFVGACGSDSLGPSLPLRVAVG